ncbi:MAG: hypothetical protein RI897_1020 [Verrucomicrobiota bacterium]|jgi:hypothetical protein
MQPRRIPHLTRITSTISLLFVTLILAGTSSCCHCPSSQPASRHFQFGKDTFSFANELRWEYGYNHEGVWEGSARKPAPEYSNHCFAVARAAKQFFWNATFEPDQPKTNAAAYSRLIKKVMRSNPRKPRATSQRIPIPGYANLHTLSLDYEASIKKATGGAWHSYVQRGNWRMVFPFSRKNQDTTAHNLAQACQSGSPTVVHLVDFPSLKLNHAVVVYALSQSDDRWHFEIYDPNEPAHPRELEYTPSTRQFVFPENNYFPGGPVHVYPVYCNLIY